LHCELCRSPCATGYGMEANIEKTTVMRTSWQPSPIQIMTDHKPQENVE